MLETMILAAAVWVCPGNTFSDEPREGCHPFHETHGSYSTNPEPPGFTGGPPVTPQAPSSPSPGAPAGTTVIIQEKTVAPAASAEQCALYDEWMRLSLKQDGTTGMHDLTTQEMERWSVLRQMFSVTAAAPNCPPRR